VDGLLKAGYTYVVDADLKGYFDTIPHQRLMEHIGRKVSDAGEAQRALDLIRRWTSEAGLTLHPEKTRIVNSLETGFDFLGYHFVKHRRFPRRKSLAKFKAAIRAKTHRNNGHGLNEIIKRVNGTLRGWFE